MPPVPKPKHLRQNRIKRPEIGIIPVDSKPVQLVPRAPAELLPVSKRRWRAFWQSPVAQIVDRNADMPRIERWIQALDEFERASAVFKKARLTKGSNDQPVLNPLAGYLAQLQTEIARAETDLGLTPLARLRLGIAYGQARLTAEELNRALEVTEPEPKDVEEWEREWIEG